MKRVLFVGGPADGERRNVEEDCRELMVRSCPPVPAYSSLSDLAADTPVRYTDTLYRFVPFRGSGRGDPTLYVAVPAGRTPDWALRQLVAGYRQPQGAGR